MKKLFVFVAALLTLTGMALFAADPVEGLWKSVDEDGVATAFWKIYEKNGVLYGEILKIVGKPDDTIATAAKPSYKNFPVPGSVNQMKVVGTPWIYGLKKKAPGQWEGGFIIDVRKGDIYNCKITFRPADGKKYKTDVLEMRGEIGLGIGRSQYWLRATEMELK
ncbi:DUF2147 domain-containing protein [Gracilinema caldarium]|uniref:DUF2147 domain-containing protein n=1 Tax=Gracilinema caldarium (strain ATCC 51460 / DSM 7334 / H1) TaxID=744872 RepID=F8F2L5_GRAC1|nr:DUF2147 domain-containing protein [Gracilinema caldarium]AEJ19130.1 Protein of unknown function DUF2147 [Gracilinema caldarium DSM 7334]